MDVAEVVKQRVREVRERRGWTQRQLVDRLKELGVKLDPASLARIETGKRAVKVQELVELAAALEVSPLQLMLPTVGSHPVDVTPKTTVTTSEARAWARALGPLPGQSPDPMVAERGDDDAPVTKAEVHRLESELAYLRQLVDTLASSQGRVIDIDTMSEENADA